MITLNIKEPGHLIDIAGMKPFRTPARVDISKGDVRTIVGYLKVCNITDYEIVASNQGITEVYEPKDFEGQKTRVVEKIKPKDKTNQKLIKRINRLEEAIKEMKEKPVGDSPKKEEQTTNQTELLQAQILDAIKNLNVGGGSNEKGSKGKKERDVDEPEPFIPDIDIEGMKLKGQGDHKTVKKEKGSDDAADALSKLLK